jgi:hypothetical protein
MCSDRGIQRVANQNFNSRYLFAEDVAGKTVRGPTWHLIRDYYNFYKRIESSASGFVFDPEPFYPNSSEFNQIDDTVLFHNSRFARGDDGYGEEIEPTGIYRYMPTRGSYTPILLGYRLAFTLKVINWDSITEEGDLALVLDPFFYLWNPYDQSIRFENVKVRYTVKMPIHFTIAIDGITYEAQLNEFVTSNFSGLQNFETFLNNNGEDYTMEPGAITVFSSSQVGTTTESWPGPQLNDASGLTLVNHPKTGAPLRVTKDSLVNVEMTVEIRPGAGWFITDVFNVDDTDYAASAGSFPFEPVGASRMQRMFINLASPLGTNANWSRTVTQNNISVDGELVFKNGGVWDYDFKYSIGYFDNLMKGTLENGDGTMHVAPFGHFNPTSSFHVLHWRWVPLNRFSFLTSEPNLNSMLPEAINVGQAFWGKSYASSGNVTSVPVREIPTSPIVSLAGLSSADIGHYVFDPVRVVGSSGANPLIPLDNLYDSSSSHLIHDTAWLANDALWDSYYFSGIVPDYSIGGAGYSLNGDMESSLTAFFDSSVVSKHLNSRIKPYIAAGDVAAKVNALDPATRSDGYRMLSANAVMDGAFNVNSTSADAWKAILSANRSIRLQASDGSDVSPSGDRAPFPKSAQPLDSESDEWRGYASLGEDEISQLADAIVDQIRLRGPFMSLSDFVNRRLENDVTGSKGALQAAIDSLAVNSGVAASSGISLDYSSPLFLSGSSFAGSSSASAIGGYLMQSDLLRSIGSLLTVRSDTFRITAYGESTDLVTGEKVIARCEALVQRLPEYVDSVNSPDDALSDLEPINLQFGRRFKVMSFNWIN